LFVIFPLKFFRKKAFLCLPVCKKSVPLQPQNRNDLRCEFFERAVQMKRFGKKSEKNCGKFGQVEKSLYLCALKKTDKFFEETVSNPCRLGESPWGKAAAGWERNH
jgi:hypothetical protein